MLRRLLIAACLLLPLSLSGPAFAFTPDGDWNGTLDTPAGQLRILFHFQTADGALQASLTSVDQASGALAADKVTLDKDVLTVSLTNLASHYDGRLGADGASITGTWTQNGKASPLNLKPGSIAPRKLVRAPQAGDLSITTPTGALFGTIWKAGDSRLAAVIITGSGPANRNGDTTVNGANGTYRLIAEGLQAHGITALSVDKRGIGESAAAMPSEGVLRVQTYGDDIRAWAHALKTRTAAPCVWLVGHSEGALVAELAAAGNADICGIVTMAGMGRKPADVLRAQLGQSLTEPLKSQAFAVIAALEKGRTVPNPPQELMGLFRPSVQPYMISELALDPAALLQDLKMPVLILQGDTDVQVSVADAQALAAARPGATLNILPGVNHNQRLEAVPRPAPLAPGIIDTIAKFLKAHS